MAVIQEPGAPLPESVQHTIRWLVNRYHVSTPDETIKADMLKRLKGDVDARTRKEVVEFALRRHHRNQEMYVRVMRGDL